MQQNLSSFVLLNLFLDGEIYTQIKNNANRRSNIFWFKPCQITFYLNAE